ncbi:unnamed protein product [marine sediment metagenome]|uniref:Uncharacterized protein n=1 Tax=marine sediment metagenome TaxID=412755 RepID=X1T104_9ZZZZ
MTTLLGRTARHFYAIKAARQLKEDIEKAGLDSLKVLADAGKSIVGIYLEGCSPEEKKRRRRDGNTLLQLGVPPEMVLTELARLMPELQTIMEGKQAYKQSELLNLEQFLRES